MGFSVVFMSTASEINAESLSRIKSMCWLILQRRNIGLDIGGWPCAVRQIVRRGRLPLEAYSQIVLANDSVFGPLRPLDDIFRLMGARALDMWGITESQERARHVQSYFLVFQGRGVSFLADWLRRYRVVADREELISRYEVGLSLEARRAGLQSEALISSDMLSATTPCEAPQLGLAKSGINPVHAYWRRTLELGAPFIKRDLVVRSESGTGEHLPWRDAIGELMPSYPLSLIEKYLETSRMR